VATEYDHEQVGGCPHAPPGAGRACRALPAGVEDRDADVWEPLLAVADLVGGDWLNLARRAATELVKAAREIEPSLNIRLLEDLRTIFESEEHKDAEHLATRTILAELCLLEIAPWNNLKGKPITDNQLARRLRQYGVKSKTLRLEDNVFAKGYAREDLHDVWRRYLPRLPDKPVTGVTAVTAQSSQKVGASGEKSQASNEWLQGALGVMPVTGTVKACDALGNTQNRQKIGDVPDVTPVTTSAENGREPSLSRGQVEAESIGGDGALRSTTPARVRMKI
jgi:hypothetical protein